MKQKFKILGMHCSSCAMSIDFDLEDLDGVKNARTSFAKQETEVEFDDQKLKLEAIVDQIKKTGYQAKIQTN